MRRILNNPMRNKILIGLLVVISFIFLLPQSEALAKSAEKPAKVAAAGDLTFEGRETLSEKSVEKKEEQNSYTNKRLPENKDRIQKIVITTVTAYNAVPWQTDDTPCIAADGTNVCNTDINVVAANWLPFGTKVKIPEYFGDTVFEVHDRMNKRFSNRLDILMTSIPEAKRFGVRKLKIVVLD